ncbi:unnamed protein product [Didymodactylos carnosus]|uniref:Helix-turn-helix domain-containing protein n=1 Tax=Didymodactylos carnosus TaxID=1234261 RepID=A0A813WS38_9BILA|nr:unnamed protein product [Didymodactylos carnosus]CAF3642943.1 unnamed protein product [Didymodactylos carnosus]
MIHRMIEMNNTNTDYRRPIKKEEQIFIYEQLELLDQQYCLEMDQQLWQSYLDIDLQHHIWPANSERKYLSMRNNDELFKFKDDIYEKDLFKTISTSPLLNNQQNEYLNRLITTREKQAGTWKEQLILEIRIHCKFLTQNFDHLENFISPLTYLPLNNNQNSIEVKNKRYKIIHEGKLAEVKDEHKDIYTKIKNHLVEYPHCIPRTKPIFDQYSAHLLDYFNHCYCTPLSYKDQLQTLEQAQIVASIGQIIKNMGLIIRITDKGHNFYIGLANEFEKKAEKFFSDTNAFIELSDNPFNEIFGKVVQLLDKFQSKKFILQWQFKKMMPDREEAELAHLYFNPKTHKVDIPVRPIENTIRAPTTKISKFLDELLQPIFDDKCKKPTIINGAHLITELSEYTKKGLFQSTTLFCTFDIHNLYTMLPQDEALNTLMEFLHAHGYKKVKGINLDIIRKLAFIVIKENVFAYANIFMWKWQKKIVDEQATIGEYYGRYIDDIFMTWNKPEKDLIKLLGKANEYHTNVELGYKIDKTLPFLDVLLTNDNGTLFTSVYHKPAAEPYVVPFISHHPRHVFTNIIKTSLTHAIRYSSTFQAFNYERRYIKLTLLYNDLSRILTETPAMNAKIIVGNRNRRDAKNELIRK